MTFSAEWEAIYGAQKQIAIWPWSDLVSYVMRYSRASGPGMRVLEIGCGAGANIPFFLRSECQYYAVEGSASMVSRLHEAFPALAGKIVVGDFTKDIPFDSLFDLVVDRAALTHNDAAAIRKCLRLLRAKMRPGSKYVGIDWFSTSHSDSGRGREDGDSHTRTGIESGQFAGVGRVHFSDRSHLESLFEGFDLKVLEEKIVRREIPGDDHILATWNLCAVRP